MVGWVWMSNNQTFISPVKEGLSTTVLKYVAMVCMIMNHLLVLVPHDTVFGDILSVLGGWFGALAIPLFSFCLVEGYRHTGNVWRYALRLGILAFVSYFPYVWFFALFNGMEISYTGFNIFFSFLLGLFALIVYRSGMRKWQKGLLICLLYVLSLWTDGRLIVISLMLIYEAFYSDFERKTIWSSLVLVLFACFYLFVTAGLWNDLMDSLRAGSPFFSWYSSLFPIDFVSPRPELYLLYCCGKFGGLFAVPLLTLYNGVRGGMRFPKFNKWFFYIFYPAHLLLFTIISTLIY